MALQFDPVKHEYKLDGRVIPGVTEVLRDVGVIDTTWYTESARDRGTSVHVACKQLIDGTLDWSSLDEKVAGYVCSFDEFLRVTGAEIVLVEERVHTNDYAGTLDVVLKLNGEPVLIDEKSGSVENWCQLQTAAYALALEHSHDLRVKKRFGLKLKQDGSCGMLTSAYTNGSDLEYWRACLLVYSGKRNGWAPISTHRQAMSGPVIKAPPAAAAESPVAEDPAAGSASPLPEVIVVAEDDGVRANLLDQVLQVFGDVLPGKNGEDKVKRMNALAKHFGTPRWNEMRSLSCERLREGLEALRTTYRWPRAEAKS